MLYHAIKMTSEQRDLPLQYTIIKGRKRKRRRKHGLNNKINSQHFLFCFVSFETRSRVLALSSLCGQSQPGTPDPCQVLGFDWGDSPSRGQEFSKQAPDDRCILICPDFR